MRLLQIGVCAVLVFAIAAHGAVEAWALAILETSAGLLFLYWAVRTYMTREGSVFISPLLPPLLAVVFLALGQLLFRGAASPYDTRVALQLLTALTLLLFLATQAFRTTDEWRFYMWFIMAFGFLVGVFGILQHLTFNGKLYWFREMRYGGIPFGPYVNRNHFAGFAELFIPMALVPLMLGKVRRERWLIVGLFAVVSIGSLFLAASRGGTVSLAVEVAVVVIWMSLRRMGPKQLLGAAAVLIAFSS